MRVKRRLAEPARVAARDLLEIQALPHQPNDKLRQVILFKFDAKLVGLLPCHLARVFLRLSVDDEVECIRNSNVLPIQRDRPAPDSEISTTVHLITGDSGVTTIMAAKILRGSNPAELPVQQSVKFELLTG